ncbi:TIM barrel protein, partial [bacterium]|nr:TIM barrel protein [bacterium]
MAKKRLVDSQGLTRYRFTFGPWNVHEGADPFGPEVRTSFSFARKLQMYRELGFDGVQFHDDDAVPDIDGKSAAEIAKVARNVRRKLDDAGLVAEFVAPRLWETPKGIDGGYTSNSATDRRYAIDRSKRAIDIANILGTRNIVLWLAREGTYIREAKNAIEAYRKQVDAINQMLDHDKGCRILIEPKPNEPMDHAYVPTMGHAVAVAYMTIDPTRVGTVMESAHSILAGLDPSDECAFALSVDKLWSVHLNDQNGLKFDQDRTFGMVNLRRAFNTVRVLELGGFGRKGEMVGLDVKVMRPQKKAVSTKHLAHSREMFFWLLEKVRTFDTQAEAALIKARDYEELDRLVMRHLMTGELPK